MGMGIGFYHGNGHYSRIGLARRSSTMNRVNSRDGFIYIFIHLER